MAEQKENLNSVASQLLF